MECPYVHPLPKLGQKGLIPQGIAIRPSKVIYKVSPIEDHDDTITMLAGM